MEARANRRLIATVNWRGGAHLHLRDGVWCDASVFEGYESFEEFFISKILEKFI